MSDSTESRELTVAERVSNLIESHADEFEPMVRSRPRAEPSAPARAPAPPPEKDLLARHEHEVAQMAPAIANETQALLADVAALQRELSSLGVLESIDPAAAMRRRGELAAFQSSLVSRDFALKGYAREFNSRCVRATAQLLWGLDEARAEREFPQLVAWLMDQGVTRDQIGKAAFVPAVARQFFDAWRAAQAPAPRPVRAVRPVPSARPRPEAPSRVPLRGQAAQVQAAGEVLRRAMA